jgi:EmrB/QacA subfamily drug resistance transporter
MSPSPSGTRSLPIHELSYRRRIGILAICSMSLFIVSLDVTIVNVALPSIRVDLHASISGLQWIIDGYTLVLASFLLLSGSAADRLGRRRTFVVGLSIFVVASLLCSVTSNLGLLVAFRMLQAIGGSMLNPVAMSIITNTFTVPRERAQAIGVWAAVMGVSMALGPVVGGLLVSSVGWRSIFWVNVPVGLVAIVLSLAFIPESRAARARRVDVPGQFLVIALLSSLTFGIIEAPSHGWSSGLIIGAFALAGISLIVLLVVERRRREPLLDLRFFRSVPFAATTAIAVASFAALGGFLFLNTLYLQDVRGLSALHAGIDTLPMAVMTMLVPPLSGWIVGRHGSRIPLLIAGAAMSAGCVMLVAMSPSTPFSWLFIAYMLFGLGFGSRTPPFPGCPATRPAWRQESPRAHARWARPSASRSSGPSSRRGLASVTT